MSSLSTLNLKIESYTSDLLGKGKINRKEYFFPYVQIGDRIYFQEIGRRKQKRNQILEIQKQSLEFLPKCSYFSKCGGCRAQQIPYDLQFQLKTLELTDYYYTQYGIQPKLIPASKIWNYRNRMDFVVVPEKIGLRGEGNFRQIIDIAHCEIQSERANLELSKIRDFLKSPEIAYDRKQKTGYLKYLTLRTNSDSSELMLILTFIDPANGSITSKVEEYLRKESQAEHILFCYNRERAEVSAQGRFEVIKGNYFFQEKIFDKTFEVPFDSFFQPNPIGFLPILDFIKEKLINLNYEKLLDLFCGTGFFSIVFGDKFPMIQGFDFVPSSIERANTQLKKIYPTKQIRFEVLDLYQSKENSFQSENHTVAILDPPRNGLGKNILKILENSNIPILFYVSCNPKIQRTDFEYLSKSYRLIDILITDPYPHTPHLESVMYLERAL